MMDDLTDLYFLLHQICRSNADKMNNEANKTKKKKKGKEKPSVPDRNH